MLNLRIPDGITESMTPSELGTYMRELREQFRFSLQDVSDRLRIRVRYLEAIEAADIHLLPAKVYARGYVQCYAEFLGIDPQQTVNRYFGAPTKDDAVPLPLKPLQQPTLDLNRWRSGAMLLAAVAVVILIIAQIYAHAGDEKAQTVPDVPEAMLVATRTMAMPTPTNFDCFAETRWIACLQSTQEWHMLDALIPSVAYAASAGSMPLAVELEQPHAEEPTEETLVSPIEKPIDPFDAVEKSAASKKKPTAKKPGKKLDREHVDHETSVDHNVDHNAEW